MNKQQRDNFIADFKCLCEKYDLALVSDDPYCALEVVPYEDDIKEQYEDEDSFGRWQDRYDESTEE